jgi:hypothetical protein
MDDPKSFFTCSGLSLWNSSRLQWREFMDLICGKHHPGRRTQNEREMSAKICSSIVNIRVSHIQIVMKGGSKNFVLERKENLASGSRSALAGEEYTQLAQRMRKTHDRW